jgi:hypothetical protein
MGRTSCGSAGSRRRGGVRPGRHGPGDRSFSAEGAALIETGTATQPDRLTDRSSSRCAAGGRGGAAPLAGRLGSGGGHRSRFRRRRRRDRRLTPADALADARPDSDSAGSLRPRVAPPRSPPSVARRQPRTVTSRRPAGPLSRTSVGKLVHGDRAGKPRLPVLRPPPITVPSDRPPHDGDQASVADTPTPTPSRRDRHRQLDGPAAGPLTLDGLTATRIEATATTDAPASCGVVARRLPRRRRLAGTAVVDDRHGHATFEDVSGIVSLMAEFSTFQAPS